MRKILFLTLLIVAIACALAFFWVQKSFNNNVPKNVIVKTSNIDKLKNFYLQYEDTESQIHALQQKKADVAGLTLELTSIQDSIDYLRTQIEREKGISLDNATVKKSDISVKQDAKNVIRKYFSKKIFITSVIVILCLVFVSLLIILVKKKLFGKNVGNSDFTPYYSGINNTTRNINTPKENMAPTVVNYKKPEAPRKEYIEPEEEQVERTVVNTKEERIQRGSSSEEIIKMYEQGFSVKDISSRLKVEQDKVSLALRVHGKK